MPGSTPILHLPYPLASEPPDGPAQIKALADALDGQTGGAQGLFIVGEVRFIAVSAAPGGWRLADGSPISRATYAKLFAAIGTAYGVGDGSTTFNVPDLRGRAPIGAGAGTGLTSRAAGVKGGSEPANMPSHNHGGATGNAQSSVYLLQNTGDSTGPTGVGPYLGDGRTVFPHTHPITSAGGGNDGFGQPVDNMPPFVAIPAYIYAGA